MPAIPQRPRSTLFTVLALWFVFYGSFTLVTPPLLDDADSVHAEVAREMLLRHDYVTLYANGIRYLEKAPLLYWSMAASMRASMAFGAESPQALAAAARVPLALTMLALALLAEAFARRLHRSQHAGLYAALILLSSFGIFLFTRITIPDAMVCLWITLALYAFYRTEESDAPNRLHCGLFAAACALNVLTKGLIGVIFPLAIITLYLLLTRGLRGTLTRIRQLHPLATLEAFLLLAAPWHILAGLANPTQGHPTPFHFTHGHWQVPLPTDGNVRGWFWFYFMNEHLLRYLNLRVPHDYDTAPLYLFWGLCFLWLMPWSAFVFKAAWTPVSQYIHAIRVLLQQPAPLRKLYTPDLRSPRLLLIVWAAFILLFFSLSTRQEYYILPALPALAILIAGWLESTNKFRPIGAPIPQSHSSVTQVVVTIGPSEASEVIAGGVAKMRVTTALLSLGSLFALATIYFLLHTKASAPNTDLAGLLQQNPGDYALSMGHFLDLNARALGLFRFPLALAAVSLFLGPLMSLLLRRKAQPHAATLVLAAGAFGFLLAAHLGLRTFSPVLTSAQLAEAIASQVQPNDNIIIHGEYESASTLAFYLHRPSDFTTDSPGNALGFGIGPHLFPMNPIGILDGRSSNLWYGSFFPDAPPIFETPQSLAAKWHGPQRIFLWQSLTDPPNQLPTLPGPIYVLAKSGGKEIVSNQPNH